MTLQGGLGEVTATKNVYLLDPTQDSISAVFKEGYIWKGSNNGDGNSNTSGTVTLIR